MKTLAKWGAMGLALALLAAVPVAAGTPALGALYGGGIVPILACVACAGGGLASLMTGGSLAWVIWTMGGTAVAMGCAASCIAAVT